MIVHVTEYGIVYLLVLHLPQVHLHSLLVNLRSSCSLENGDVQLGSMRSFLKPMYTHVGQL